MSHKATSTDTDRLVSLANGSGAYVFATDGSSHRFATDSPDFTEAVAVLVSQGQGKKVRAQIDALAERSPRSNWPEVRKNLEAAGVFPS